MNVIETHTLIIGCGIAGATAALTLSDDPKHNIIILTRTSDVALSNTAWAQGGIVIRGLDDSPDLLVNDILQAGDSIGSEKSARILADEGPDLVQKILVERCGVNFDKDEQGDYQYGLEAAHSTRRIVHVGDKTGKAVMEALLAELASRPNVTLLNQYTAIDLITKPSFLTTTKEPQACHGAYVLDRENDTIVTIFAGQTIMATGGLGAIYQHSTNPTGARGDGIAMAWRAGVALQNMEYIQFHPTALAIDESPLPLISEAVRGEGAVLLTQHGEPFMHKYAPDMGDLAPRDVVARAMYFEMTYRGQPFMYLDLANQRSAEFIRHRFPQLIENTAQFDIDPTTAPIPVMPAAHYSCGGIQVDRWARTSLKGLYAVGEVSCTGLHGANRLASTSLLEGLVWGNRAARYIKDHPLYSFVQQKLLPTPSDEPTIALPVSDAAAMMKRLGRIMWDHVGLMRTENGLYTAIEQLNQLEGKFKYRIPTLPTRDDLIGLRNAVRTGWIIANAARSNPSSNGSHFRSDVKSKLDAAGVLAR